MVNKSGIRGSKWERDLLAYFREAGHPAERLAKAGSKDEGDLVFLVHGTRPVVVEAKALRAFDLAAAVKEINVEKVHYADARGLREVPQGIAVLKRPGSPTAKAYVVMELDSFLEWLRV